MPLRSLGFFQARNKDPGNCTPYSGAIFKTRKHFPGLLLCRRVHDPEDQPLPGLPVENDSAFGGYHNKGNNSKVFLSFDADESRRMLQGIPKSFE